MRNKRACVFLKENGPDFCKSPAQFINHVRRPAVCLRSFRRRCLLAALVGVRVVLAAHPQADRRARHVKIQPQAVDQIAAIAVGHLVGMAAHHHKPRRAGFGLGHIAQLDPLALRRGRRVRLQHAGQPAVQLRGGHAAVPDIIGAHDRVVQPVQPRPVLAETVISGAPRNCGNSRSKLSLQIAAVWPACPLRCPICSPRRPRRGLRVRPDRRCAGPVVQTGLQHPAAPPRLRQT